MAFVVTSVITKNSGSVPDFDEWTRTSLDLSLVYQEYPDLNGMSIDSIIDVEITNKIANVSLGFVSESTEVSANGLQFTTTTTWETQEQQQAALNNATFQSYDPIILTGNISAVTGSTTVTGTGTDFINDVQVGNEILANSLKKEGTFLPLGTVTSIESETSLTLESNSEWTVNDRFYTTKLSKLTPLAFIQDLYATTYPVTEEITFANV